MAANGPGGSSLRTCEYLGPGPFTPDRPQAGDGRGDPVPLASPVPLPASDGRASSRTDDTHGTSVGRQVASPAQRDGNRG
jgi:hypothetical protein